jgi:hypothetical protein
VLVQQSSGSACSHRAGPPPRSQDGVAKPEHDGKSARVLSFDACTGCYAVALDDGQELSLKAEFLQSRKYRRRVWDLGAISMPRPSAAGVEALGGTSMVSRGRGGTPPSSAVGMASLLQCDEALDSIFLADVAGPAFIGDVAQPSDVAVPAGRKSGGVGELANFCTPICPGAKLELPRAMSDLFHLPLLTAVKASGMSSNAFHKECRKYGMQVWPFKDIRSWAALFSSDHHDNVGATTTAASDPTYVEGADDLRQRYVMGVAGSLDAAILGASFEARSTLAVRGNETGHSPNAPHGDGTGTPNPKLGAQSPKMLAKAPRAYVRKQARARARTRRSLTHAHTHTQLCAPHPTHGSLFRRRALAWPLPRCPSSRTCHLIARRGEWRAVTVLAFTRLTRLLNRVPQWLRPRWLCPRGLRPRWLRPRWLRGPYTRRRTMKPLARLQRTIAWTWTS